MSRLFTKQIQNRHTIHCSFLTSFQRRVSTYLMTFRVDSSIFVDMFFFVVGTFYEYFCSLLQLLVLLWMSKLCFIVYHRENHIILSQPFSCTFFSRPLLHRICGFICHLCQNKKTQQSKSIFIPPRMYTSINLMHIYLQLEDHRAPW